MATSTILTLSALALTLVVLFIDGTRSVKNIKKYKKNLGY